MLPGNIICSRSNQSILPESHTNYIKESSLWHTKWSDLVKNGKSLFVLQVQQKVITKVFRIYISKYYRPYCPQSLVIWGPSIRDLALTSVTRSRSTRFVTTLHYLDIIPLLHNFTETFPLLRLDLAK